MWRGTSKKRNYYTQNGAGASSIFSSIKNIFGKKDEENPQNVEDAPKQSHAEKRKTVSFRALS